MAVSTHVIDKSPRNDIIILSPPQNLFIILHDIFFPKKSHIQWNLYNNDFIINTVEICDALICQLLLLNFIIIFHVDWDHLALPIKYMYHFRILVKKLQLGQLAL